jgi:hypothetical protein
MDCLVVAYAPDRLWDRSNSHKVLEYLSTGRAIVSTHVSAYRDQGGLIRMAHPDNELEFPILFRDTISRLDEFNSPPFQEARREFALDNTYSRQLDRIESRLASLGKIGADTKRSAETTTAS